MLPIKSLSMVYATIQKHIGFTSRLFNVFLLSLIVFTAVISLFCSDTFVAALDNAPEITLVYPIGGEILNGTITIQWVTPTTDEQNNSLLIYCFYTTDDTMNWQRMHDEPLSNTSSFTWSTTTLSDGHYRLLIEAVDATNQMGTDKSGSFIIDNDKSNLSIGAIKVTNTLKDTDWVKNGDDIEIAAEIMNGGELTKEDIWADLSVFSLGNRVNADSFDGRIAHWLLNDIFCYPPDGTLNIAITAKDLVTRSISLTADNTPPQMAITKPLNGFYLFNKKFFPLSSVFIVGPIKIQVQIKDNYAVNHVEYYCNDVLLDTVVSSPYALYVKTHLKGRYTLKVLAYDGAGNTCVQRQNITIFTLIAGI
jgi:hypothetical protein